MKSKTRKILRVLGIGLLVSTVSLAYLAYAAVSFVKQAVSRIEIDGNALAKVMEDAVRVTLREGTSEQKIDLIASFADASPDSASYYRPLLIEAAKDRDPEVSRAARTALERIPPGAAPSLNGGKLLQLPRMNVRGLMAADASAGVALWLAGTAWRVHQEPRGQIVHMMQDRSTGALSLAGHSLPPSFWPHYCRALFGQPWPGGYPCACRLTPDPGKRELASAADSGSLIPAFNRVSVAFRLASEHKIAVENLGKSNAWDERRVRDLDAQAKELTDKGQLIIGADGVRKALLNGIAVNQKSLEEHERLYQIYHAAAISPTILTDPEVVDPEL